MYRGSHTIAIIFRGKGRPSFCLYDPSHTSKGLPQTTKQSKQELRRTLSAQKTRKSETKLGTPIVYKYTTQQETEEGDQNNNALVSITAVCSSDPGRHLVGATITIGPRREASRPACEDDRFCGGRKPPPRLPPGRAILHQRQQPAPPLPLQRAALQRAVHPPPPPRPVDRQSRPVPPALSPPSQRPPPPATRPRLHRPLAPPLLAPPTGSLVPEQCSPLREALGSPAKGAAGRTETPRPLPRPPGKTRGLLTLRAFIAGRGRGGGLSHGSAGFCDRGNVRQKFKFYFSVSSARVYLRYAVEGEETGRARNCILIGWRKMWLETPCALLSHADEISSKLRFV